MCIKKLDVLVLNIKSCIRNSCCYFCHSGMMNLIFSHLSVSENMSAVLRLQYHCVYTLSAVLFLALFSGLRAEWVSADAWCLGSSGMTWCIHGPNHPLTVSPRCPGWPGSPSFPAGPWVGRGGWRSRQFRKDLRSWVHINISKARIESVTVDSLQTLTAATHIWSFGSRETNRSLWSLRSLGVKGKQTELQNKQPAQTCSRFL